MRMEVPLPALLGALAGQLELIGHLLGDQTPIPHALLLEQSFQDHILLLRPDFFLSRNH